MSDRHEGPGSAVFVPIRFEGGCAREALAELGLSEAGKRAIASAPAGDCVSWGMRFQIDRIAASSGPMLHLSWPARRALWFVFMHTTDLEEPERRQDGFFPATRGQGRLGEHIADYSLVYADGSSVTMPIRRRRQIGMFQRPWGINCFEAVCHSMPYPLRTLSEQPRVGGRWGTSETRVAQPDAPAWANWLWAWENPHPELAVVGLAVTPRHGMILISAISAGDASSHPLRWEARAKAVLKAPADSDVECALDSRGRHPLIQLDMGQVISVHRRSVYPENAWETSYNNQPPAMSSTEAIIEYTAHPDAHFHLSDGSTVPVAAMAAAGSQLVVPVPPARHRVRVRVVERGLGRPIAAKLHIHGSAGEYLQPTDRARIPNGFWYEDWSVDYVNPGPHLCTYISGETTVDLPFGRVYIEASKGFEIRPVRCVADVGPETDVIEIEVDRVLRWRERGWVTADTHVHFLSPPSAQLEGAAEGVNVVNLLASQWGELMTNVGDYDGRMTWGSREAGGDGEFLVRVGTENRQHVLGHISLLGYSGPIIAPMTVGGPDESALGDPVDILLLEWARQCRSQDGLVVLPHFPNPRAEHAAAIIEGAVDAVEMTSWSNLYGGIDPYSLSDWYRYLNCGHFVAAVGGTDKMAATTAVGAVRTYARLPADTPFTYDAWKQSIRGGNTFVTYGPLIDFSVEGRAAGSRIGMPAGGGTLQVEWSAASVTVPMSRVDLMVNGEIRGTSEIRPDADRGAFAVSATGSCWVALLVRGHYADRPEIIVAHTSPVMVEVEGSPFFSAPDAITILDQIEGALAFLDTIGTRAETRRYREMHIALTGAYRSLHNRLHQSGVMHEHTPPADHHG